MLILKEQDPSSLMLAVDTMKSGGVVAFATETVYALAADAKNDIAVARLYEIKKRDVSNPIAIWLSDKNLSRELFFLNLIEERIIDFFMPGSLTLILKKKPNFLVSHLLNRGGDFLGLRIPNHDFCLNLLKKFGGVIAATSANLSGNKPATNASEVIRELGDKIDLLIDGGHCFGNLPSTVLKVLPNNQLEIIRFGLISEQEIKNKLRINKDENIE